MVKEIVVPDFSITRLKSQFYSVRFPYDRREEKYSAVTFNGCNFKCYFCFESGHDPDGTAREELGYVPFEVVRDFVAEEIENGNPIEITGGEPTLYPEVVLELLKFVKEREGFVCLATNGSAPDIVERLAPYIDVLGLDIKTTREKIDKYTGVSAELSFDLPLQTLERSAKWGCDVHFKRIMFSSTTLEELEFFYPYASHAYWILKQLRPFPRRETEFYESENASIESIANQDLQIMTSSFIEKHPDLKGRLVTICGGSGRDPRNYTYW